MMRRFKINALPPAMIALAAWALLSSPPAARAALMLESHQAGITDTIFVDQVFVAGVGDPDGDGDTDNIGVDTSAALGQLSIGVGNAAVQVGSFAVSGSAHTSNSPGDPTVGGLLISHSISVVNNTGTAATQQVVVGDTNYSIPHGPFNTIVQASGTINNGTIRVRVWDDPANRQFGGALDHPGAPAILLQDLTFTNQSYNVTTLGFANFATVPYSKTIEFDITLNPGGSLVNRSDSIQNAAVPEPATVVMALTGLPLLGGLWLRRRQRRA